MAGTSKYPTALDQFPDPTLNDLQNDPVVGTAARLTALNDAVEALQAELGTDPSGSFATVQAYLDALSLTAAQASSALQIAENLADLQDKEAALDALGGITQADLDIALAGVTAQTGPAGLSRQNVPFKTGGSLLSGKSEPFYPRLSGRVAALTLQSTEPTGQVVTLNARLNGTTLMYPLNSFKLNVGQKTAMVGASEVPFGPTDFIEWDTGVSSGGAAVRDSATFVSNSITSFAVPIPAGTQEGDYLVSFLTFNDPAPTNTPGWTLGDTTVVAGTANSAVHRIERRATATGNGVTITLSTPRPVAVITVAVRNVDTTTPTEAVGETAGGDTNTLTITTTSPNAAGPGLVLRAAAWRISTAGATGTVSWSGGDEVTADLCTSGGANNVLLSVTAETQAAADAVTARTATSTATGRAVAQSVIMRPGAAPVGALSLDALLEYA